MDSEERQEILNTLEKTQQKSAKITVQIGHTRSDNQMVMHDTLIIKDAPPIVQKKLQDEGYRLELTEKGMFVHTEQ